METHKEEKTVNVYGVEMTRIQEFKFSKYLNKLETPRPNTLTTKQRFDLANNWLLENA